MSSAMSNTQKVILEVLTTFSIETKTDT